jgi:DNA processing protein
VTDAFIPDGDPCLPDALRQVALQHHGLWFAGDPATWDVRPRIGIIGSRHPRGDAQAIARRIALGAGRLGCCIVSGLAIGIDGMAHRAALDAGAPTIAVLAGGLANVHPVTNREVARSIAGSRTPHGVAAGAHPHAHGLVVSEYGPGDVAAMRHRFLERNRIIATLSDYLVVVQAGVRSGSMTTAKTAIDLGVPLGIVPSSPDDPCYAGSLDLIQDGADAVVDHISLCRRLEVHGIMARGFAAAVKQGAVIDPARRGSWIGGDAEDDGAPPLPLFDHPLASLLQVPRPLEELAQLAGLPRRDLRRMLLELEEDGDVRHTDDGTWIAASIVS